MRLGADQIAIEVGFKSVSVQGKQPIDRHEPNDTCDQAAPILPDQTITGTISSISDTDHYTFLKARNSTLKL